MDALPLGQIATKALKVEIPGVPGRTTNFHTTIDTVPTFEPLPEVTGRTLDDQLANLVVTGDTALVIRDGADGASFVQPVNERFSGVLQPFAFKAGDDFVLESPGEGVRALKAPGGAVIRFDTAYGGKPQHFVAILEGLG